MVVSMKKVIVLVILALALLAALVGWTARMETRQFMPSYTGIHSSHAAVAWYCPAPPFMC